MNKKKSMTLLFLLVAVLLLTACGNGKSARQYYKEGMKFFQKGSYQEAIDSLAEAVKKNPERAEYYIAYGMSLVKTEQYDTAIIQFDKAIIDKDNQIVRENNKRAYRGKGIAYYEAKQYESAIECFAKALEISELDEINMDILSYKADAEGKTGNYDAAVKSYTSILKLKKKNATVYAKRAQMEAYLGKTKVALADYEKAIGYDKNNYDFYFGLYFLYQQMEDTDGAKKVLTQALAIKTKTDEDYYNVARIHYLQEDYKTAKSEFTELAGKDIQGAYYYLAKLAEMDEDYKSAAVNYEKYLNSEAGKNSAESFNQLGICYMKLEKYEKALNMIEEGIKLNESTWSKTLSYNEVSALEHVSQYDDALEKAAAYLELYPEDEDMLKEYSFIKTRVNNQETKSIKTPETE